jgi:coatomer protein complex subunit gamma
MFVEAIDTVIEVLGMASLDNSSQANKTSVSHTLVLSGLFVSGERSLVRCRMVYEASSGVTMEMTIRSDDAAISQAIAEVIG